MQPPSVRPSVPFGFAAFPKELTTPPRRLLERAFRVERFTEMPRDDRFAALEEPERLATDIAAFFRPAALNGERGSLLQVFFREPSAEFSCGCEDLTSHDSQTFDAWRRRRFFSCIAMFCRDERE